MVTRGVPISLAVSELSRSQGDAASWQGISQWLLTAAAEHPRAGLRWLADPADASGGRAVTAVETGRALPAGAFLSYAGLLEQALHIQGGLRKLLVPSGAPVLLLLEHACDFLPALWGCILGGYLPCPLLPNCQDRGRWEQQLAQLRTLLEEPLAVCTPALQAEVCELRTVPIEQLRAGPLGEPCAVASPDQDALLVLTSGSTGHAKAVTLTHRNLAASMTGKNLRQRLTGVDITLNWIACDHVASLLETHLLPLSVGATQLHIDPAPILADPLLFLRIIHGYRVSMTFTPNFLLGKIAEELSEASKAEELQSWDLSCLRHIISGGEPNPVSTGARFLELLAPAKLAATALWPAFGMSESCAGSIYSDTFPRDEENQEFASVGTPVHELQLRIVDERDLAVSPGESGELQLRGPMIFSRYYRNEPATQAAFTSDGWFRTGDLGCMTAGCLRLRGRSKDTLIVNGASYFLHQIETALARLPDLDPTCLVAFPTRPTGAHTEQLVVAFTPKFALEDESRLEQLLRAIRNTTVLLWGFRPAVLLPLPTSALPKTSLGKNQPRLLRKRLETGVYANVLARLASRAAQALSTATLPASPTEVAIAEIFGQVVDVDPHTIGATVSFLDLGGSSLELVKLQRELQAHFAGVSFPLTTLLSHPTVRELAQHITAESHAQTCMPRLYDPVVPLQVSGTRTPVFCVHAASGEVLVFFGLASYFASERPFYALRARGFATGEPYFGTMEELVATYVVAIRRRQPKGPYALAGYSYGAPVAFELAKVLEAQGEHVAFLASIDGGPTIGNMMARLDLIDSAVILAFFLGLVDPTQRETLPDELRARHGHAPESVDAKALLTAVCAELWQRSPPARRVELGLDLPRLMAWVELSHALVQLGEPYQPTGSVQNLTVFYARPLSGTKEHWLTHHLKRWDTYVRTPVRYIEVDGEHHTLFEAGHLARFQGVLRAELQRALQGQE